MSSADDKKTPHASGASQADFSHWQLPDVTPVIEHPKENMFGRIDAQREVKPLDEPVMPPTLEEIESIRAEAEAEGFAQGKEAGFAQGIEEGRLQGLEQGHQEGYRQGEEQGLASGLAQAQQNVAQFEAIMQQLSAPLSLLDTEIEQALVQLSMTLAKAVIGHELHTHPEHILAALRQGVDALPLKEQGAHLRLHPEDIAIVERLYESTQLTKNHWELESDPTLSRGECIVSNSRSRIDMGLEHRIKAVFEALVQSEQRLEQQRLQQIAAMEKMPEADSEEPESQPSVTEPSDSEFAGENASSDASQEISQDEDPSKPTT